jgi:hypothetical protein
MSAVAGVGSDANTRSRLLDELRAVADRPLFHELALRRGHLDLFSHDEAALPSWKPVRDLLVLTCLIANPFPKFRFLGISLLPSLSCLKPNCLSF